MQLDKPTSQILRRILNSGKSIAAYLLWAQYTPQYDLMYVSAEEIHRLTLLLEYVRRISRLSGYKNVPETFKSNLADELGIKVDQVDQLFSDDLDDYAAIWLVDRLTARKAKGTFNIYFDSGDWVNIDKDTIFKTESGTTFKLDEQLTNAVPIFSDGSYIVRAILEANETGAKYNIPSGITVKPEGSIPHLTYGESAEHITTGRDKETDDAFVDRIIELRKSRTVGSKSWLKMMMYLNNEVLDCEVYAVGDDEEFHRQHGADVWVQVVESPKEYTDTVYERDHIFEQQPLTTYWPVKTEGLIFVRDDTGIYSRSVYGEDKVVVPDGTTQVTYYTDQTIRALQAAVEDSDYWLVGSRRMVLVKRGYPIPVNVGFTYYLVSGSTQATVEAAVRADLNLLFSGGESSDGTDYARKVLHEDVDMSDVLEVILRVDGVDRVDTTTFYARRSDGLFAGIDPITIRFNEFAVLGNVAIVKGV